MKFYVDERLVSHGAYEIFRAFFREEFDRVPFEVLESCQGFFAALWFDDQMENLNMVISDGAKRQQESIAIKLEFSSREFKLIQRQLVYRTARDFCGHELPWGLLTGIRPTKMIAQERNKGKNKEAIRSYLRDVHYVSKEKIDVIFEVDAIERPFLEAVKANSYSLYVGIPFCPTRCSYCSFPSYARNQHESWVAPYLDKLDDELQETAKLFEKWTLSSVYIGGGTPTALHVDELRRVIRLIRSYFSVPEELEFTVEAGRPDTLDDVMLKMLRAEKINRISINPQTMSDETLIRIGRSHDSKAVVDVFHQARKFGFEEINMDLIVGLPGERKTDLERTLSEIGKLQPDHLTVHSLAVKRASSLGEKAYRHEHEELWAGTKEVLYAFAKENKYVPYYLYRQKNIVGNLENVGFTKPDHLNLYNIYIMSDQQTIAACGVGAVSKFVYSDQIERVPNAKSIPDYLKNMEDKLEKKANLLTKFGEYDINTGKFIDSNDEDE
jgi:oxygen-independent coproporphyrinogen-3 oxidase